MAFNIMDLVAGQFTPDNIRAIAGALGEEENQIGTAVSSAAPAMLSGLLSSLSEPGGKQAFEQTLERTDDDILDNIAGVLGGGGASSLIDTGSKLLGGVLGGNSLGSLAGALSSFTGLSRQASSSLLGLAGPMLLGTLKRKGKADGLDLGGLINMLTGQKKNIAAALPAGLAKELSGTGILEGVADAGASVQTAATNASREVAQEGGSLIRKILPLALLLIAAFVLYQWFSKPAVDSVDSQAVSSSAMSLATDVRDIVGDTADTLRSIDSVDSARSALGNLQGIDRSLDSAISAASNLPAAQSEALASAVSQALPGLQTVARTTRQIPGVGDVIGASLDSIESKLVRLTQP